MTISRWETERAAWLKARAGSRPARRRRAEQLALAARQRNREEIVAGDSPFGEVTTRNVFYRSVHREEGAANTLGWFFWTLAWIGTVLILLGPALLIGLAAYGIWWVQVARWGRLRSWPYLAGGAGLAVAAGLVWLIWSPTAWAAFGLIYVAIQLVLGLIRAAWRVRAWGWPAVERAAKAATTKVSAVEIEAISDETPEAPIAPVAIDESPAAIEVEAEQRYDITPVELAPLEDGDEAVDDFPVFDDEDSGLEDVDDEPTFDDGQRAS